MWTKLLIVIAVTLTAVSALPRERRQLFGEDFDTSQVVTLLKNKAFVQTQAKCAMATEAEATAICDRVGRLIRLNVADMIRTLQCPGKCTTKELKTIVQALDIMVNDYPDIWEKLLNHYKITPEQKTAIAKWRADTLALPDDKP